VVILGTALEEAQLAMILGTTKCRCLHVFTFDLYGHDLVYGCYVVYGCDKYCEV
jgi:RAB protein geranylgeranyltransferase component A